MKKLTKSMKVILVSIISAVCVLGIVLGCIFINKGDPNNPSNNPPAPVPEKVYTWAEKFDLLTTEVNVNKQMDSFELINGVPYQDYLTGDLSLKELASNYFVIGNNENSYYYHYTIKNDVYVCTLINDTKSNGGLFEDNVTSINVEYCDDEYIVVYCADNQKKSYELYLFTENELIHKTSFSITGNIVYDFEFSTNKEFAFFATSELKDGEEIEDGGIVITTPYLIDVASNKIQSLGSFESIDEIKFDYNGIFVFQKNKITFLTVSNNNVLSAYFEKEEEQTVSNIQKISLDQYIVSIYQIDKENELKQNSYYIESSNTYMSYSYKMIKVKNNNVTISNYSISNNSKLDFETVTNSFYFYSVIEQKISANNKLLDEKNIYYYFKDNSLIFSTSLNSQINSTHILKIKDYNVLTQNQLLKVSETRETELLFEFGIDNNILRVNDIFEDIIPYFVIDNDILSLKLLNMDGQKLLDDKSVTYAGSNEVVEVENMLSSGSEIIIIDTNGKYLKFDKTNFNLSEIEYIYTKDEDIVDLLDYGMNCYFTYSNERYSLYDFSNKLLVQDIIFYNYVEINYSKIYIELTLSDGKEIILNYLDLDVDYGGNSSTSKPVADAETYDADITIWYYIPTNSGYVCGQSKDTWFSSKLEVLNYSESQSLYTGQGHSYITVSTYGWRWQGWSTGSSSTSISYTGGEKIKGKDGDVVRLYAVFYRDNLTAYYVEGTSRTSTSMGQYMTDTKTYEIYPSVGGNATGWTHLGYRNDNTASTAEYTSSQKYKPSYSTTTSLRAVYSRTATISYNGNGSTSGSTSGVTETIYMNAGSSSCSFSSVYLAYNGFHKTGFIFKEWALDSATGTKYSEGASFSPISAISPSKTSYTFYAVWNMSTFEVAIDYNWNGKTEYLDMSSNATAIGDGSEGFYLNHTITNPIYFTYSSSSSYRKWYMTYNSAGSFSNETAISGSQTPLPIPTRLGYVFQGYYASKTNTNNQVFTSAGIVTTYGRDSFITSSDLSVQDSPIAGKTVYAHWTRNSYDLNFIYAVSESSSYSAFILKPNGTIDTSRTTLKSINNVDIKFDTLFTSNDRDSGWLYDVSTSGSSNNVNAGYSTDSSYPYVKYGSSESTLSTIFDNIDDYSSCSKYFLASRLKMEDTAYVHVGWKLVKANGDDAKAGHYLFNETTKFTNGTESTTLEQYIRYNFSPQVPGPGNSYKNDGTTRIYLCAIYKVRESQIGVGAVDANGATSSNDGTNLGLLHTTNTDLIYKMEYPYTAASNYHESTGGGGTASFTDGSHGNLVFNTSDGVYKETASSKFTTDKPALGTNITFDITLEDSIGNLSYAVKYIIFYNFPYKLNENVYGMATLIFTISDNGGSIENTEIINEKGNGTSISTNSGVYYIGSSAYNGFNTIQFTLSSAAKNAATVKIENLNYLHDGSNIDKETVKFSGTKHFKMVVVGTPLKENVDIFDIKVDNSNNTTTSVKNKDGQSGALFDTFATDASAIPNGAYVTVPIFGDTTNGFYFWFNGVKHTDLAKTISNRKLTITVGMQYSSSYKEDINLNVYVNKYKGDDSETAKVTASNYLAYINIDSINNEAYTLKTGTSSNNLRANYGNSEIFFIEPTQSSLLYSDNNDVDKSLIGEGIYYQPTSYLSNLFDTEFYLTKEKNQNLSSYKVNPKLWPTTWNSTTTSDDNWSVYSSFSSFVPVDGSTNKYYYTYNGVKYEILQGFLHETTATNYYLFLTQASDGRILYILVGVGNTTGNIGTQGNVTFKMKAYTNTYSVSINKTTATDFYGTSADNGATYEVLKSQNVTGNTITPASTLVIKISPSDGYLINNIVVTLKKNSSYIADNYFTSNLELLNKYLSGTTNNIIDDKFYLYAADASSGQTPGVQLVYTGTATTFESYSGGRLNGIFYHYDRGGRWSDSLVNFESMYIMISGLYHSVDVSVKTISYMEFDFIGDDLDGGTGGNENRIWFANSSNSEITLTNTNDSSLILKKTALGYSNGVNRLYFFGYADELKNGISIHASGKDYSYYFTNASYYGANNINPLNEDSTSSLYLNTDSTKNASCIYLNTGNMKTFFNKSYVKSTTSGNEFDYSSYFSAKKYVMVCKLIKHKVELSSQSWLASDEYVNQRVVGQTYYQVDDPATKRGTWFNDTKITNIGYAINGVLYGLPASNNMAAYNNNQNIINWQDPYTKLNYYVNKNDENIFKLDGYDVTKITSDGYGFNIRYYRIPGYYLEQIGITYTLPASATKTILLTVGSHPTGEKKEDNIYYRFDSSNSEYIDIYLYPSSNTFANIKSCLNILAGGFKVDLYSSQFSVKVLLDANIGSSTSSSTLSITNNDILTVNGTPKEYENVGGVNYKYKVLTYDRISEFNALASMTGYTFVGWGSQNYYASNADDSLPIPRYSQQEGINTWNTTSSWTNTSDLFKIANRVYLNNLSSSPLGQVGYYNSDFYVADGYFMTDTGFNSTRSEEYPKQNYNFWSVYSDVFVSKKYSEPADVMYQITLYGVWKPNTYYVSLNLNDKNAGNGTTVAATRNNGVADATFNSVSGGIILPDTISGGTRFQYTSNGNTNGYDLFVIFDTNKWYLLLNSNYSIEMTEELTLAAMFAEGKIVDFKQFVIDRYGYTWLGWFSKQLDNAFAENAYYQTMPAVYPKQANQDTSKVYATDRYINGKSNVFMTFNYSNFNTYFLITNNVKEVDRTHLFYFNEFKYNEGSHSHKNLLSETGVGTVFFYKYSNENTVTSSFDINTYSVTLDYINGYYNGTKYEFKYSNVNYKVTYYDTAYDYYYFKYTYPDPNDNGVNKTTTYMFYTTNGNKPSTTNKSSFRHITLYAYWETNLYDIQVNFMDSDNNGIGDRIGSTKVTESDRIFLPAYFDDANLYNRLVTFLPVRVGYDFVGWTFNPLSERTASSGRDNLHLNNAITGNLYTNLVNYNAAGSYADRRDSLSREVLGDDETLNQVYLFAVWRVQKFSINISLNINGKNLSNLYDYDSTFALALYNSSVNQSGHMAHDGTYAGITTTWLKQKLSDELTFIDIAANVEFVIDFDAKIDTAKFVFGSKEYTLDDLFATSAGYYFTGLFTNPSYAASTKIVTNLTNSSFDGAGALKSILEKAERTFNDNIQIEDVTFNETFYNSLLTYTYEEITNNNHLEVTKTTLKAKDYNHTDDSGYSGSLYPQIDYKNANSTYYTTLNSSSNKSTNFGYITIPSLAQINYISYEGGADPRLYFYDRAGKKVYLLAYIEDQYNSNLVTIANSANSRFTFDENNFYYNGNIIKFEAVEVNGIEYNSYFVDTRGSYNTNELKRLRIYFAYDKKTTDPENSKDLNIDSSNVASFEIEGGANGKYIANTQYYATLVKTRIFTLFANWEIKQDLNIDILNGNIGTGNDAVDLTEEILLDTKSESEFMADEGQTPNANYGLAGYYNIYNLKGGDGSSVSTKPHAQAGHMQSGISMGYTFYEDLDLFISPYFDGRFLSEISFKFYAHEQQSDLSYKKITYVLTLKFDWDPVVHNIDLVRWELTASGGRMEGNDITNDISELQPNVYINSTENSILSVLDKDITRNETVDDEKVQFIGISEYITRLIDYTSINHGSYTNKSIVPTINTDDGVVTGRKDLNYIKIHLYDLMTSAEISCKFAVQTYTLEVYNVFDSLGNTLEEVEKDKYIVGYESFSEFIMNSKSVWSNDGRSSDYAVNANDNITKNPFSNGSKIATIGSNIGVQTYNLPYGFYIYGKHYDANRRPVGVEYDPTTNIGYYTSDYTGYKYIYDVGIYNYGDGSAGKIINNTNDLHSEQCSPILGSKTLFAKSVREASSLYSFVSWYVPEIGPNENVSDAFTLIEYDAVREATKINDNTIIIGYYFANNKPTSLNYYTWDDTTKSYVQYKNNIEEYTLQSNASSEKYTLGTDSEVILASGDVKDYMDENNCAILYANETYGVDVATFGAGANAYTRAEMMDKLANHTFIEENLIRNYWFYRYYYTYIEVNIRGVTHFVRYDVDGVSVDVTDDSGTKIGTKLLHFYYLSEENNLNSTRKYIQLLSSSLDADSLLIYVNDYTSTGKVINVTSEKTLADWVSEVDMYNAGYVQVYKENLEGSKMFAYDNAEGGRYYPIKKIEDYDTDLPADHPQRELFASFYQYNESSRKHTYGEKTARFYVEVGGQFYYLLATSSSQAISASDFYQYHSESFDQQFIKAVTTVDSKKVVNIDSTDFVLREMNTYNDAAYEEANVPNTQWLNETDRKEIQALIEREDINIKYFMKYNGDIFYVFESDATGASYTFKTYSAADFTKTSKGIVVANLDNYYLKYENEFYAVNYPVKTDELGSKYYNPYTTQNTCIFDGNGETQTFYFNYSNKQFYHDAAFENKVSTNGFDYKVYTPVNNNYRIKLGLPTENSKETDVWEYKGVNINSLPAPNIGFWYNNENYDYVGYVDFKASDLAYISSTVVKSEFSYIQGKERIYDVFEEYINVVYKNEPQQVRDAMMEQIKPFAASYAGTTNDIGPIKNSFITAGELVTTKGNSVDMVNLIIPVTIKFSYSVIIGGQVYSGTDISITVTVKYLTTIITKDTVIDETIHAIPIYSRNVMKYTDSSVTKDGTKVHVVPGNMDVNFFENVGNIDTRFYNALDGDYLKIAVLDEAQFNLLKNSEDHLLELTYVLGDTYKGDFEAIVLSEYNETYDKIEKTISFDFASDDIKDGTYYMVAYYEKMGNYDYVIRSSDNVIKVVVEGSDGSPSITVSTVNYK